MIGDILDPCSRDDPAAPCDDSGPDLAFSICADLIVGSIDQLDLQLDGIVLAEPKDLFREDVGLPRLHAIDRPPGP